MKLIGRKVEVEKLIEAYESPKSELVAVYGRRRIGKTFLIREVLKNDIIYEVSGLHKGSMKEQLRNFHDQILNQNKKISKEACPEDWSQAFNMLIKVIESSRKKGKKVIFIDEFPWIATQRSKFLMWFENFWNSYCTTRADIMVVICGSAASYMVKNIIKNKGGLHNRITLKIRLEAFNLLETKLFLKHRNISLEDYDLIQLYMCIGGIPYYLELIKKGQSVAQNIDSLCFEKGGQLTDEFNEVFASLFENSSTHIEMVKALSKLKKGINRTDLFANCNLKQNGYNSSVLTELIESGFVTQYKPFGKKDRGSLFRLTDEYSLFYLKYIENNKNQGAGIWERLAIKQSFKIWTGFAFETLCLKHIQQIKTAIGVSNVFSINSSWANNNAQIDLVIDRDDNRINLCEIKFYDTEFIIDKQYMANLRNKKSEFIKDTKTRKGVYLTFITTFGLKQNSHSLNIVENEITMESLFLLF